MMDVSVCSRLRPLLLAILLLSVAGARPATIALADSSDSAEYRQAVEEGVREFGAGNFEEARALFGRAHALLPNARTFRGLGMAEFELRDYASAVVHLEASLGSRERPLDGSLRADTEELLTRANRFVARVVLRAEPVAAQVLVDGIPAEVMGRALLLQVGRHVLEFSSGGYDPETRIVNVSGGEVTTVAVTLKRPRVVEPSDHHERLYRKPWLWTTVGVVVAGAVAGTAVALNRRDGTLVAPYGGSSSTIATGP